MKKMNSNGLLSGGVEPGKVDTVYETCAVYKQVKKKFPSGGHEDNKYTRLMCSDIMGFMTHTKHGIWKSICGYVYWDGYQMY
jgi:hypothetical protein